MTPNPDPASLNLNPAPPPPCHTPLPPTPKFETKVGVFIAEGKAKGIDLSGCNFIDFNNSNPIMTEGSIKWLQTQMKVATPKGKLCTPDPSGEFHQRNELV